MRMPTRSHILFLYTLYSAQNICADVTNFKIRLIIPQKVMFCLSLFTSLSAELFKKLQMHYYTILESLGIINSRLDFQGNLDQHP